MITQSNKGRLAALGLAFAATACADPTATQTATIEGSCDTWTVDDPVMIWPPNHKMHQYSLDDCVTVVATECPPPPGGECGDGIVDAGEDCDDGNDNPFDGCDMCIFVDTNPDVAPDVPSPATGLSITSITSSEPDDLTGDGTTTGDTVIVDATTFQLRAERRGNGDGRTYLVHFVDATGETGTCTFYVPHASSASDQVRVRRNGVGITFTLAPRLPR